MALAVGAAAAWIARDIPRQMGAKAKGARLARVQASPQFAAGKFRNTVPATEIEARSMPALLIESLTGREARHPHQPIPVATPPVGDDASGLHVTWLGHSSALVEIEGRRVLLDPVWSERCSPSHLAGPKRLHEPPVALRDLPPLDAVVISHDHYDHLDTATIDWLVARQTMPIVVPLGIGAHLARWGVPQDRIVELDWDQEHRVGPLTLTCTEARHFSGRSLGANTTLWSSWVIAGERRRVYFGGDTGYTPAFTDLGAQHGPFDLTVLPIGAYDARWRDVHLDPREAVQAHRELRGEVMLPIHWATFDLAFHAWADPVRWAVREADEHGVRLATPAPGGRVEPDGELPADPWWEDSV